MVPLTISELKEKSAKIRRQAIEMIYRAGSGHPGGSLSATDILVALFFGGILKVDPRDVKNDKRDRFILSCGHEAPAYYAVLAEMGFFNEEALGNLRALNSPLQGHPARAFADFVESSTGSLGQGLAVGVGMAWALKFRIQNSKPKVVVLSSDGEQDEGSHWESVMFAGHHHLDNLNLIIDQNGMQIGGWTKEVLDLEPLLQKYRLFGWEASQVDGHDLSQLISAFSVFNRQTGKPKVVICKTIRGKGVSFMEGSDQYHSATLSKDEYERAIEELE